MLAGPAGLGKINLALAIAARLLTPRSTAWRIAAIEAASGRRDAGPRTDGEAAGEVSPVSHRVLLCPQGEPLTQRHLRAFAARGDLTLVCGRYEGFDERIRHFVDQEISLGDFVLNGGEVAAMAIVDGVSRLIPGVIGNAASLDRESHGDGLLEYPQYTRPPRFRDLEVPEVLLGGDHGRIADWRRLQMMHRTRRRRPDLWRRHRLDPKDRSILGKSPDEIVDLGPDLDRGPAEVVAAVPTTTTMEDPRGERAAWARRTYLALLHHPVYDRKGRVVTTALTNLDLHDIARSSRTYGLGGYFIVTPLPSQQRLAERIVSHWREGHGANVHEKRREALKLVDVFSDLAAASAAIEAREGEKPLTIATSARSGHASISHDELGPWIGDGRPVLLLLGTGWGLTEEILDAADLHLAPVRGTPDYNHLSVRSAAAIILDRCFAMRE